MILVREASPSMRFAPFGEKSTHPIICLLADPFAVCCLQKPASGCCYRFCFTDTALCCRRISAAGLFSYERPSAHTAPTLLPTHTATHRRLRQIPLQPTVNRLCRQLTANRPRLFLLSSSPLRGEDPEDQHSALPNLHNSTSQDFGHSPQLYTSLFRLIHSTA